MDTDRRERHVTSLAFMAQTMKANARFILPCQSAALDNFSIYYPIFSHQRIDKIKNRALLTFIMT